MRGILAGDALGPCRRGAGEGPPRVAVTQPSRSPSRALCSHFLATLPSCSRFAAVRPSRADLGGMAPPPLGAAPGRRVGGAPGGVGGLLSVRSGHVPAPSSPARSRMAAARSRQHRRSPLAAASPPPARSRIAAARSQPNRCRPRARARVGGPDVPGAGRTPSEQGRAHRYACCARGDQGPVGPSLAAAGAAAGEKERSAFLSNRGVGQWTDLLGRVTGVPYT